MRRFAWYLSTTLLTSALVGLSPAVAQVTPAPATPTQSGMATSDEVDTVVVTARRKVENIQKVPLTVAVVSTEMLRQRNDSLADLVQLVPGLQENSFQDRNDLSFAIRGQQFTFSTAFPAVITYFAEVPLVRISTGQTFDLSSIQVLEGPQGTLFGRVTDGGAVLLTPQKPTDNFGGYLEGKYGNYNEREVDGALNVPILEDKILLRGAFDVRRRDGFTYNTFDGKKLDDISYEAGRITLLIKPFVDLENTTIVNYNHSHTNGTGTILLGFNPNALAVEGNAALSPLYAQAVALQQSLGVRQTYNGTTVLPGPGEDGVFYKRKALYAVNTTVWKVSPSFAFKNIFGYVRNREVIGDDYDGTALLDFAQNGFTSAEYPLPDTYSEQFSDETQIQGKALDSKLDFTAGTYFDYQHVPGKAQLLFYLYDFLQSDSVSYARTRSSAVYGQIGYDLGAIVPGLKFNGGLRYTRDTVNSLNAAYIAFSSDANALPPALCLTNTSAYPQAIATLPCTAFHAASHVVTYTVGLDWQISHGVFAYYTQRKGYRPGGVNANQGGTSDAIYGPEYDLSHELGLKSNFSLGAVKFRANIAGFIDDYTKIQEELQVVASNGTASAAIVNAAAATIKGFELEVAMIPVPGLTLSGNWAYLDAHYRTSAFSAADIAAACPANPLVTAANPFLPCPNNPLPQTPKDTIRLAAEYVLSTSSTFGRLSIGGDYYHVTSKYINGRDVPAGTIPGYGLINANLRWSSIYGMPVDASVFVNNLANKTYLASLDSVVSIGEFGRSTGYYGPPRMYGASLIYHFGS